MEKRKTFASKDMVGTPRGYVKKEDVERVDREMQPVIDAAGEILPFLPFAGPASRLYKTARGGQKLIGGSGQKLLTGPAKQKEISKDAFEKAVTVSKEGRNLERRYRAEKATSALGKAKTPTRKGYTVKEAAPKSTKEPMPKRIGPTNKTGSAAVRIVNKDAKASGPKKRKPDSGTFTSRVDATRKRERTAREKEQFGPLAKRRTTEVAEYKRPGGPVKKYERPGGPVSKYERQGGPVAKYERQGGALTRTGGGDDARIVGLSNKAKMGLAGIATAGLGAGYLSGRGQDSGRADSDTRAMVGIRSADANRSRASAGSDYRGPNRGLSQRGTSAKKDGGKESGYRGPNRGLSQGGASGSADRNTSGKQSFKDKMQGRNWKRDAAKSDNKPERKVERKAESKPKLRGNWKGASPSAMQARGGVRRTKAENLRRFLREK